MTATLPTNWTPNHAITAAELAQVLNAIQRQSNIAVTRQIPVGAFTTTSATYTTITNVTAPTFTKLADSSGSNVLVEIAMTAYRTVTASNFSTVGVSCNGTDTDVAALVFNTLSQHQAMVGYAYLQALAAGTYTITPRVKTVSGTFNFDTGDQFCMKISEIPL